MTCVSMGGNYERTTAWCVSPKRMGSQLRDGGEFLRVGMGEAPEGSPLPLAKMSKIERLGQQGDVGEAAS